MSYSDVPRVYPQRKEARQWSQTLYRRVETNRDKKMPRQITALELFSGVGGEAIALKEAGVKTIGYCEINEGSAAILRNNMKRGRLDKAPIYPDVSKLAKTDLPKDASGRPTRVDVIAGGFPCLGLSAVGTRQGLYGDTRSNLVKHVFRLVGELRPSYVFLENTPLILKDENYADLVGRFTQMGYKCAFILSTASQVGASHLRQRWFMLCMRKGAVPFVPRDRVAQLSRYFRQRTTKILPRAKYREWASLICHSFGNAVVPAQANAALVTLMKALKTPIASLQPVRFAELARMKPTVAISPTEYYQDANYQIPSTTCHGKGFTVTPPKPPASHKSQGSLPLLTKPFKRLCFPTPRTSTCSIPLPTMSQRSRTDAANLLMSTKEFFPSNRLPSHAKRMEGMVSDEFWAAAMGFPKDWIRGVLREHHRTKRP